MVKAASPGKRQKGLFMHVPVLAQACIDWLQVKADGTYVDCTVGAGGHAAMIAERIDTGRLIAFDRDPDAAATASERLAEFPFAEVHHRNYGDLAIALQELGIVSVDGFLIDAGMSSMQLNDPERGFSFQEEGPLDMRMDTTKGETAAQWLATIATNDLAAMLKEFGDVGPAKRIAQAIHERTKTGTLLTTRDLKEAVKEVLGKAFDKSAVTRQTFQAIRIAVNQELSALDQAIPAAIELLKPEGRLVVIAFHSGEDRIVKQHFQTYSRKQRVRNPDGTDAEVRPPLIRILTKKPQQPTAKEIAANPRAQSAKLRAAERLEEAA